MISNFLRKNPLKRSISVKIFAAVLTLFALVFLIQWFLLSRYFNEMYIGSMLDGYRDELANYTQDFTGGGEEVSNPGIRRYASVTGSPVLVVSEQHEIADRDFFNRLGGITLRLSDDELVKIPTHYLFDLEESPRLQIGFHVRIRAVRLGESSYLDPLSITQDGRSYTNRDSMRRYRIEDAGVASLEDTGVIRHAQRVLPGGDGTYQNAARLYSQMKDCLVQRLDVGQFLEQAEGHGFSGDDGGEYRLIHHSAVVDGTRYYFVTVRKIVFSGQEQAYVQQYVFPLYFVLGVVLVIAALGLARYISRPLTHLSKVTRKISDLDFSETAAIKGEDELGRLSQNINAMSDSLQAAMDELKAASQKAADNESRMKDLLADLAHEFKTPLGVISSYTEVIEKEMYSDDPSRYFGIIDSEIAKLSDMVSEVIELSKMQAGSWKVDIRAWDLAEIVGAVVDKLQKRLTADGFTVECEPADVAVLADARRIDQVLTNFLSNAMKYSDERKKIAIRTQRAEDGRIRVAVANTGYLSPSEKERIWERFYHSSTAPLARLPREGIGLDIVRTILTAHGSEYGVSSQDGTVTFHFTLQEYTGPE